jgi:hypothetical protein
MHFFCYGRPLTRIAAMPDTALDPPSKGMTSSTGWPTGSRPFPASRQCPSTNAGLRDVDGIVLSLSAEPEQLQQAIEQARALSDGVFGG